MTLATDYGPAGVIGPLFVYLVLTFAYITPLLIASRRRVPNLTRVVLVNLFLGWTVVGWVAALVMALRAPNRRLPVH